MAGVSLNAIIGDNGIITNAQRATILNNVAEIEEFIQEYYVSTLEQIGDDAKESKIEKITTLKPNWFYHKYSMSVKDKDGHELWLIDKDNFIKDYKNEIRGGDAGNKTYKDYYELNDVYGVTSNLKVYYCGPVSSSTDDLNERMYGLNVGDLDADNPNRIVIKNTNSLSKVLSEYDKNNDGNISVTEIKYVTSLTLNKDSGVSDLKDLYQFVSLKSLTLDGIKITSMGGIDAVLGLNYLYLKNIDCGDYGALGNSNDLETLYVERNNSDSNEEKDNEQISKMLVAMKNSDYKNLTNFGIFGDPKGLSSTNFYENSESTQKSELSMISELSNLTRLTKVAIENLCLNSNKIVDFSALSDFTGVNKLYIQGNPFTDLNFIKNMTLLEELNVSFSSVNDISVFSENSFSNFKYLWMKNCSLLKDCSPLVNLSLEKVVLTGCLNFDTAKVEEIADWYNFLKSKEIDDKYIDYLQGSTRRVYISKNLNDASEQILNMMNMSADNKLKIKKISLSGNSLLTNVRLNDLLSGKNSSGQENGNFSNCVSLNLNGLSNLTNLSFLTNFPNLVEINLTGTGIKNNEVNKLEQLTQLRMVSLVAVDDSVNLTVMQKTISRCVTTNPQSEWTDSAYGGFSCGSNLAKQLEVCSDLTYFSTYNFRYEGELDLSNTKITEAQLFGNTKFILPRTCEALFIQQGKLPEITKCKRLGYISINQNCLGDLEVFCKSLKNNGVDFDFVYSPGLTLVNKNLTNNLNYLSETKVKKIRIVPNGAFNFENLGLDFSQGTGEDESICFQDLKEIEYSSDITIKNLDFLSGCKALNIIKITKCINLSDIYGISNFKNVTEIDFSSCGIVNLNPIRNFDKLETLNLTDNSLNNEIYDENVNKNINNIEILLELNKLKLKNIYLLKNKFNDTSELKKLQVSESSQIPT